MEFKSKIRKIGNSLGVIIPADVITSFKLGDVITLNVITEKKVITEKVIPVAPEKENKSDFSDFKAIPTFCEKKHKGRMIFAKTCGCY
jgi:antitoxin component of MazEF toxin-antitoxin module